MAELRSAESHVAMVGDGLNDAPAIFRAITYAKIRQNLFWAFASNVVGIPLAALGVLSPVIASAAMALSSASVVAKALLLNRCKPEVANGKDGSP